MRYRLPLGALLIAGLIGLMWLDGKADLPGKFLFPLAILLAALSSGEILGLCAARKIYSVAWVVYAGNILIVAANWVPWFFPWGAEWGDFGWPLLALAIVTNIAFLAEMARYTGPGAVTERLSAALLSFCYLGALSSFTVQLRFLGPGGAWGIAALASLVIVVKMCDTGAYTVGRLIGKHKMAPVLSPGKTIEGAIGGLVFACFGAWVALRVLAPRIIGEATSTTGPWWHWVLFGLFVGAAGMWGDLAESLLKRDLGRKDSSTWMPGFGGVLDIMDSIMFASPAAFIAWKLGWAM